MQLFFFVSICLFGLLALVNAEPGNFYIGECIGCNKVDTPKTGANNTQSANSETDAVAEQGHLYIGMCTNCTENKLPKNATGNAKNATADPVVASLNGTLGDRLSEILIRIKALPGAEDSFKAESSLKVEASSGAKAVQSAPSKPVANSGNFYIGECIGCNKVKKPVASSTQSANPETEQVAEQGQFYIGLCTNCTESELPKNKTSKAENATANAVTEALFRAKAALEAALEAAREAEPKLDPKEVFLGRWRNYAIIARPML